MNKKLLITLTVGLFLLLTTIITIKFAKGYRLNLKEKRIVESGLLVANSYPTGASVFINDKLTTATNDTLNLLPGEYHIKIVKDGYFPWEKNLKIEKELVYQTDARLFPSVPDLRSLTTAGAANLTPSPDGEKIAFAVASSSANPKNGLWILEMTIRNFGFSQISKQIAKDTSFFKFTEAKMVWSPNAKQILAWTPKNSFLLEVDKNNDLTLLNDVTVRLPLILRDWEEELKTKYKEKLTKIPDPMEKILSQAAKDIYFSSNEEKFFYVATASATIPENLIPPPLAPNNQPEQRIIEPQKIYVYDLKEDKNFFIAELPKQTAEKPKNETEIEKRLTDLQKYYSPVFTLPIQWFPTSKHILFVQQDKIVVLEYDGTNHHPIYAGPLKESFAYPWPDGSKIVILTSLNPSSSPFNLYALELK